MLLIAKQLAKTAITAPSLISPAEPEKTHTKRNHLASTLQSEPSAEEALSL